MENSLLDNIKPLLKIVADYQKQKKDEDAKYSIFYVLSIYEKEVTLHSRIIKDLLNPNGYHGQGNTFLDLF